jgi:hypothetical protein
MTIVEMDSRQAQRAERPVPRAVAAQRGTVPQRDVVTPRATAVRRRPPTRRPGGAALAHPRSGVLMSRASHRRPITPVTTVLLALVAAGITVWLGLVAHLGGVTGASAAVPAELAVVQVQSGETLHQVARRVAPDAPVGDTVTRIRELNGLDTAALQAGQTLIAPVG